MSQKKKNLEELVIFLCIQKHIGRNPRLDRVLHNGKIYLEDIRQTLGN